MVSRDAISKVTMRRSRSLQHRGRFQLSGVEEASKCRHLISGGSLSNITEPSLRSCKETPSLIRSCLRGAATSLLPTPSAPLPVVGTRSRRPWTAPASQLNGGEPIRSERISEVATEDLAYTLEIERTGIKAGGSDKIVPVSLRVTTIFRREDGAWRIVHRHADPITSRQSIESLLQQQAG
jgi:hypothetical protein